MSSRFAVACLAVTSLLGVAAQSQAQAQSTVSAVGEAVIRRAPDRAIVTLSVSARGATPQEAQTKVTTAMKAVQDAVEALKLPGGQVMTTGLYVNENWDTVNNSRVRQGYVASHNIVVRFDDVSRAGEVMTVAATAGATGIGGVRFDRRDREALEEEALKAAVGVARARAEAMAAGAGKTLGPIIRIAEERAAAIGPEPIYRQAVGGAVAGVYADASVPVASGEIEIRMRVVLSAEIK